MSKKALNLGIILAGGTLNFSEILGYGAKALPLIILNILIALAVSYLIGRYLKLSQNTRILVGGGDEYLWRNRHSNSSLHNKG